MDESIGAARPSDEQRVRELAYQLWEADGRPEEGQDEYWYAAERRLSLGQLSPGAPIDPHPSDEDRANVYNPSPGGDRRVEGREGDLEANPKNPGSIA